MGEGEKGGSRKGRAGRAGCVRAGVDGWVEMEDDGRVEWFGGRMGEVGNHTTSILPLRPNPPTAMSSFLLLARISDTFDPLSIKRLKFLLSRHSYFQLYDDIESEVIEMRLEGEVLRRRWGWDVGGGFGWKTEMGGSGFVGDRGRVWVNEERG